MSDARPITLTSGINFESEEVRYYSSRLCGLKKLYKVFMDANEGGETFSFATYCRIFYNIPEELTTMWEQQGGCL